MNSLVVGVDCGCRFDADLGCAAAVAGVGVDPEKGTAMMMGRAQGFNGSILPFERIGEEAVREAVKRR